MKCDPCGTAEPGGWPRGLRLSLPGTEPSVRRIRAHDAPSPAGASLLGVSPGPGGAAGSGQRAGVTLRRHRGCLLGAVETQQSLPMSPGWQGPSPRVLGYRVCGRGCLWFPRVGTGIVYPSAPVPRPTSADGGTLIMTHLGQQPHHLGTEDVSLPKV